MTRNKKSRRGYKRKGILSGGLKSMLKYGLNSLSRLKLVACFICLSTLVIEGYAFSATYESQQSSPASALGALSAGSGPLPQAADFQPRVQGQGANLYTGDMSLNIPLLTVPGRGGLDYPVGLSYQAGIKVDQEASWVGLGWNLTPGAITRNVVNYPDDYAPTKGEIKLNIAGENFTRNCGGFLYTGTHTHNDFDRKYDYKTDYGKYEISGSGGKKLGGAPFKLYTSDPTYTAYDWGYKQEGFGDDDGDDDVDNQNIAYSYLASDYLEFCMHAHVDNFHNGHWTIKAWANSRKSYSDVYPCDDENPDIYSLNGERLIVTGKPNGRKFHLQKTQGQTSSELTIDDAVKIEYATNSITGAIKSFIVTGKDGAKYFYDYPLYLKNQKSTFITKDGTTTITSFNNPYPYAWLLTAILSPDYVDGNGDLVPNNGGVDKGNWIRFNYVKEVDDFRFRMPYQENYTDAPFGGKMAVEGDKELAHLESIQAPTHIAYFDVANDRKDVREYNGSRYPVRLKEVRLYNKNNFNLNDPAAIIKSVCFDYDYHLCQGTPDSSEGKLALLKISQYSRGGKAKGEGLPPTEFTYHQDNPNWAKYKWDCWGYYYENGSERNHNFDGKLNGLKPWAWSLSKVTYPTGGSTEWEYESDEYSHPHQKYGGGIRVGTVTVNDGLGNKTHTRYLYNNSGATPISPPPFLATNINYEYERKEGGIRDCGHGREVTNLKWTERKVIPQLDGPFGSPQTQAYVGYSKVTVIPNYDPNNSSARPYGYIIHEFTNPQTHPNEGSAKQQDLDYKRGLPTKITYYDKDGNVKKVSQFTYTFLNQVSMGNQVITGKQNGIDGGEKSNRDNPFCCDGDYIGSKEQWSVVDISYGVTFNKVPEVSVVAKRYWIPGGVEITERRKDGFKARCHVLKDIHYLFNYGQHAMDWFPNPPSEVVFEWSVGEERVVSGWARLDNIETTADGITTTTEYEYNPANGLVNKKIEKGDNETRVTQITYGFEQYLQLKQKHILSPVYNASVYKKEGESLTLVSENMTNWGTDTTSGGFYPQSTYQWLDNIQNPNNQVDAGEFVCTSRFLKYDAYGNLLQEVEANNGTTTYFYGDNSKPYHTPKANGSYEDSDGGGRFSHAYVTAVQNASGHTATTYYNNDTTVGTITDANNTSTFYLYDAFVRLKKVIKPGDSIDSPTAEYDYYYALTKGALAHNKHEKPSYQLNQSIPTNLNIVTTYQKLSGTKTSCVKKLYDGLGRIVRTELENGDAKNSFVLSEDNTWKNDSDWQECNQENIIIQDGVSLAKQEAKEWGTLMFDATEFVTGHNREWHTPKTYHFTITQPGDIRLSASCRGEYRKYGHAVEIWFDGERKLDEYHGANGENPSVTLKDVLAGTHTVSWKIKNESNDYSSHMQNYKIEFLVRPYQSEGTIISQPINCGDIISWGKFEAEVDGMWFESLPRGLATARSRDGFPGIITFYTSSSDDKKNWEEWKKAQTLKKYSSDPVPMSSVKRYVRWKAVLKIDNPNISPVIKSVTISWQRKVANNISTDIEYNNLGLKEKVFNPYVDERSGATLYEYESSPLAQISKVIRPDNSTVTTTCDNDGQYRMVTVKDEKGYYTRTKFDKFGNMVEKLTDSTNGISFNNSTTYKYDILGNLIRVIDPKGNITEYGYDTVGRLIKKTHPDTGITEYRYDNNSNLRFKRDALHCQQGVWVEYRYDILNRLTQKGILNFAGDNPFTAIGFEPKGTYLYDGKHPYAPEGDNYPVGNLTRMLDQSGTTTYYYDAQAQLVRQVRNAEYITRYSYDSANNIISIKDPANKITNYTYNHLNQVTYVGIDELGSITYTYNPSSAIDKISYANGVTTQYEYYPRDWVKVINTQKGSIPVFQRQYKYDLVGNLNKEYSDPEGNTLFSTYTYDVPNRLTGINYEPADYKDINYTYDKVGNRLTSQVSGEPMRNYQYNSNQVTSDSVYTYTYYPNGNLKSKSGQGETITYYYDYENNLIMLGKGGYVEERYVYDGEGRRVEKIKGEDVNIYHYDLAGRTLCEMKGKTEVKATAGIKYSLSKTDYQWIQTTQETGITGDDQTKLFNLPFKFKFYGIEYNKVNVCSNGFLSFTSSSNSYTPYAIPNSSAPNALVAPFWRDLDPQKGGKITYESNADRFIVTYDGIPFYSPSQCRQTFQVILTKDGTITFQYKDLQGVDSRVVVGVENQSGNDGIPYDRNALANSLALKIKPATGKEAIPQQEVKYELQETDYQWIDTDTPSGITQDDQNKWFNLPFTFSYYDKDYDKVNVCSNGFMSFNADYPMRDSYKPTDIPNNRTPNDMIAPFWRDLNPAQGGKITYKDLGDKFVMSWEGVPLYGRSEKETFQVILNVDGSIIYQYKDLQGVNDYIKTGIEDKQGMKGIPILYTSLANGKAYKIVRIVKPLDSPPAQKVTITSKTSYIYSNGQMVSRLQEEPVGSPVKISYYHNDHLDSPRAITDKDGKVVESYFYYPFGGGAPVGGPSFTGKELDATGLFYFGARYYDPALGRFITPDPIQIPGENLYPYCYNNPLKYTDPTGEAVDPITIAIVAFIFGTTYEYWTFQDDPRLRLDIGIAAAFVFYYAADMLMNPNTWKSVYDIFYDATPYGVIRIGGSGSYNGDRGGWQGDAYFGVETPYGNYYTRSGSEVNYMGGRPGGPALSEPKPSNWWENVKEWVRTMLGIGADTVGKNPIPSDTVVISGNATRSAAAIAANRFNIEEQMKALQNNTYTPKYYPPDKAYENPGKFYKWLEKQETQSTNP